jgi:norsolorinic acid ketoreductase
MDLPATTTSKLITVKIDASSPTDAINAATTLRTNHDVTYIDTIIANAGLGSVYTNAASTLASDMEDHFILNVLGPLRLFQAMLPFLKASTQTPKLVVLSTAIASLELSPSFPLPTTAYGSSKATVNFVVRRIHAEEEWLIAFPISPG